MATTQLSDVYVPEVYASYSAVNGPEKTAFFESGVAVRNAALGGLFSAGGNVAELPFWKDLDASIEPTGSTDDPTDTLTPQKVTTGTQIARLASLNHGYQSADLAGELAGSDPMQQVRNRFGTYWMRNWQRRTISTLRGVYADNVANDSSDMVHDIAAEATGSQSASTRFSRSAFTTAAYTMGDMADGVVAIGCHSQVVKQMADQDDVEDIRDSEGNLVGQSYLGKRIIMDDSLPVIAGSTSGFKYMSILFGPGAIGYDEAARKVPVELEREALQGNGAGIETLVERKGWVIHPFGTQFTSSSLSNTNYATLAELQAAANWDRVVERKNVPLAYLVTN